MAKITFRAEDELKETLERLAKENGRDLTKEVLYRLKQTLKQDNVQYERALNQ